MRAAMRLVVACCLAVASTASFAWGVKVHAAIAALAQSALTPDVQAQVDALLRDDLDREGKPSGRHTLAEVASWADEIRDIAPPKQYRGWHVRANPVCSAELGACPAGHCVDELIVHYAGILADRTQTPLARNEALKWVVHLVGDLHQPLHSGMAKDRGALPVVLQGAAVQKDRTLHQVWDTELAVAALKKGALHVPATLPAYAPEDVRAWMLEAREIALTHAYEPLHGFSCSAGGVEGTPPIVLDTAYQAQSVPVIRQQMERAAARLAALLNATLK